jgi:hypothetical protein
VRLKLRDRCSCEPGSVRNEVVFRNRDYRLQFLLRSLNDSSRLTASTTMRNDIANIVVDTEYNLRDRWSCDPGSSEMKWYSGIGITDCNFSCVLSTATLSRILLSIRSILAATAAENDTAMIELCRRFTQ